MYEVEIPNLRPSKARFLKYTCPSTGRVYTSFVLNIFDDADEAMAWKLSITPRDYALLKIEA